VPDWREAVGVSGLSGGFNSALLGGVKREPVQIDGLLAGLTAAGPAFEDRLEQEDCLREGQAGRW
jgi:hypothetical protein